MNEQALNVPKVKCSQCQGRGIVDMPRAMADHPGWTNIETAHHLGELARGMVAAALRSNFARRNPGHGPRQKVSNRMREMQDRNTRCGACGRDYDMPLTKACPMCAGTGQRLLPIDPEPPKPVDKQLGSFAAPFLDGRKKARPK